MNGTPVPPSGRPRGPVRGFPNGGLHSVHVMGGGVGAGAHVLVLARGLAARGVGVTVCGPSGADSGFGFTAAGARFAPVEIGRRASARGDAAAVAALRAVCAGADVVHAHGVRAGLLASVAVGAAPLAPRRRVPLVVTWHAVARAEGPRARLVELLERRVVRAADLVLGASSAVVDRARALGARDARLASVVLTGLSGASGPSGSCGAAEPPEGSEETERRRRKVREELGAGDGPLLLSVGRLGAHRGFDGLLDACRAWQDLRPQPLLVIAGEGGRRAVLQGRVERERLPVRLLGLRDDFTHLLAAADLMVLPGRWEARALVVREAVRAGVPVVAAGAGGLPEVLREAVAVVPQGNPAALGRAVAALLEDPARRAGIARSAQALADAWPTEDDAVAQVLSSYDELLQRSAVRR
ncbi:glycosyltransferase family 4 protein [Streptomyces thermolineatus]|uniref:Glycosyltransferase family 4 protein n=1 Tax=Streptomyces thermolineatus TaxID=44033 RepID=A0ABP5ZJX1_9ACTN